MKSKFEKWLFETYGSYRGVSILSDSHVVLIAKKALDIFQDQYPKEISVQKTCLNCGNAKICIQSVVTDPQGGSATCYKYDLWKSIQPEKTCNNCHNPLFADKNIECPVPNCGVDNNYKQWIAELRLEPLEQPESLVVEVKMVDLKDIPGLIEKNEKRIWLLSEIQFLQQSIDNLKPIQLQSYKWQMLWYENRLKDVTNEYIKLL